MDLLLVNGRVRTARTTKCLKNDAGVYEELGWNCWRKKPRLSKNDHSVAHGTIVVIMNSHSLDHGWARPRMMVLKRIVTME